MQKRKMIEGDVCWGIIGVGDVCERKSAPAMQLIEHSKLHAVMRRSAEKAEDYAKRKGMPLQKVEKWLSQNLAYDV